MHGIATAKFLSLLDSATKQRILSNIASHYGISSERAYAEVTHEEAEHLLDYVTGPERSATSVLMKRYGIR